MPFSALAAARCSALMSLLLLCSRPAPAGAPQCTGRRGMRGRGRAFKIGMD
eukprot:gene2870-4550_t